MICIFAANINNRFDRVRAVTKDGKVVLRLLPVLSEETATTPNIHNLHEPCYVETKLLAEVQRFTKQKEVGHRNHIVDQLRHLPLCQRSHVEHLATECRKSRANSLDVALVSTRDD